MAAPSSSHDMVVGEHLFLIESLPAICTALYADLTAYQLSIYAMVFDHSRKGVENLLCSHCHYLKCCTCRQGRVTRTEDISSCTSQRYIPWDGVLCFMLPSLDRISLVQNQSSPSPASAQRRTYTRGLYPSATRHPNTRVPEVFLAFFEYPTTYPTYVWDG